MFYFFFVDIFGQAVNGHNWMIFVFRLVLGKGLDFLAAAKLPNFQQSFKQNSSLSDVKNVAFLCLLVDTCFNYCGSSNYYFETHYRVLNLCSRRSKNKYLLFGLMPSILRLIFGLFLSYSLCEAAKYRILITIKLIHTKNICSKEYRFH